MSQTADAPPFDRPDAVVEHTVLVFVDGFGQLPPELFHLRILQIALEDALFHADAIVFADPRDAAQTVRIPNVVGNEMQHVRLRPPGQAAL